MILQHLTKAVTATIIAISLMACTDIDNFATDDQGNKVELKMIAGFDNQTRTAGNCWYMDTVGVFVKNMMTSRFIKTMKTKHSE